jgi:hypothetical protein
VTGRKPTDDPDPTEADVEISLEDSFPASDPPGFIREARVGAPAGRRRGAKDARPPAPRKPRSQPD